MIPEEAAKLPKKIQDPITKSLPAYLKDPANYEKIQRALLETLASGHSHSEVIGWHKCRGCQKRVQDHREMMRKLGFISPAQYLAWKKTMEVIITKRRDPIR